MLCYIMMAKNNSSNSLNRLQLLNSNRLRMQEKVLQKFKRDKIKFHNKF